MARRIANTLMQYAPAAQAVCRQAGKDQVSVRRHGPYQPQSKLSVLFALDSMPKSFPSRLGRMTDGEPGLLCAPTDGNTCFLGSDTDIMGSGAYGSPRFAGILRETFALCPGTGTG